MDDDKTGESENKIKHLLEVYDKIYKHLEIANDNYFKRTQIIMITIQIVLFTGFVKLVSDIPSLSTQKLALLLSISVIGLSFACAWILYIKRQQNLLNFCKCYMSQIEKQLLKCNVPLAIFRAESVIFHCYHTINFIDLDQNNSSKSNVSNNPDGRSCLPTKFPYDGKKAKLGLTGIEEAMARFILLIWIACFIAILVYWNPAKLNYILVLIPIGVFIYWKWLRDLLRNLWEKLKECYRNWKRLFSIDQKFQDDLNKCKLSEELKREFNNRVKLSDNASISTVKEDKKWVITDENKGYIVRKRKGKLNIYRKENKEIKFWDL